MARLLWGTVLSLQLALAVTVALVLVRGSSGASMWPAIPIAAGVFVALQYVLFALTIALSRVLGGAKGVGGGIVFSARAALSEPIYFALAQLSMVTASGSRSTRGTPGRGVGSNRSPLLLVHGLACNQGIWRWLTPRLREAGFGPIYAMDLEPLRADLDVLARDVERELLKIRREHEGSRITILSHSMGGLVARAALRSLSPRTVRRIITIGTPHHGAAIARALSWLPAKQIRPNAGWLVGLNSLQEGRLPVAITSICSCEDNLVRPSSSAHLQGATVRELRGLGHFGLLMSRPAIDCVLRSLEEAP